MYVANKVYFDNRKEYFVNHGTSDIPGVKNVIPQPPKNEVPVQPLQAQQHYVRPVPPQPGEDPHYVPYSYSRNHSRKRNRNMVYLSDCAVSMPGHRSR
ncbi:MAG: hypothetical protein V8S53_00210 [Lachnospiraceae bacterium]